LELEPCPSAHVQFRLNVSSKTALLNEPAGGRTTELGEEGPLQTMNLRQTQFGY
jgi:hypothetical protein